MVYIKRDLEDSLKKYLGSREIIAVLGPRQCGKTTMIEHFLDSLNKKIHKVSFDNIKVLQLFENDIDSFIEMHVKNYDILFIDEVQYSKESGKKLKYIYDTANIKIIISGSSAAELSIHSLKYLVGRIFIFRLYTFSFAEFLRAKNEGLYKLYETKKYGTEIQRELNHQLKEFILYGGYPRVVLSKNVEEKRKVLENIYSIFLLKEIKEILELAESHKLSKLMQALSLQMGNVLNYDELSKITGFSYKELMRYLKILEETFIASLLRPYYTNKRTELVKAPKIYFYDTGFRNMCIDNFAAERTDEGSLYENVIFSELVKKEHAMRYWRSKSGAEVDFILEKGHIPIEVKQTWSHEKVSKSFRAFIEKYRPKKGYVTSLDYEARKNIDGCEVVFLPIISLVQTI